MTLERFEELVEGWKSWPPVCITVQRIAGRLGVPTEAAPQQMGSEDDLVNELGLSDSSLNNLERLPEWLTKT